MTETEEEGVAKQLFRLQAQMCQTLADPTRLEILYELGAGEKTVGELVNLTGARQGNVSQHLALMRDRGLVRARRSGSSVYYSLADLKILDACHVTREILLGHLRRNGILSQAIEP